MRICVFCGSASNVDPRLLVAARVLGAKLAERNIGLVYGGATVGMMGAVADAALEAGGEVIGVMPQFLVDTEIAHRGLTRLEVVRDLSARKVRMAEQSDAFAVLPGGFGTLDEAFEVITWRVLGLHEKPIAFLDALGFWRPLEALLDQLVSQRMAKPHARALFKLCDSPDELLKVLAGH